MDRYEDFDEIAFLDEWVRMAERHGEIGTYVNDAETQAVHRQLSEQYPVLEELARREGGSPLISELREILSRDEWRETIRIALALKGRIDKRALLERVEARGGPVLSASELHVEVWAAARKAWQAGLHRQAVGDAATAVDSMAKIKGGRAGVSGSKLFGELFSVEPAKEDRPRLRFPGVDAAEIERWNSAHIGAANFGRGCMEAIRNWAAHTLDEADEQVALEYLAALSVLARWIELAEVDPAP